MKINVSELPAFSQVTVGNVYPISGGYGRKMGHLMVVIAVTSKQMVLMLIIDKDGEPVGVTCYGLHAIEERSPVAFVPGIADMCFTMQPIV